MHPPVEGYNGAQESGNKGRCRNGQRDHYGSRSATAPYSVAGVELAGGAAGSHPGVDALHAEQEFCNPDPRRQRHTRISEVSPVYGRNDGDPSNNHAQIPRMGSPERTKRSVRGSLRFQEGWRPLDSGPCPVQLW